MLSSFSQIVFGTKDTVFYKDIRLWLLLVVINCGANLGFGYYFPEQNVKIILFIICLLILYSKRYGSLPRSHLRFILYLVCIIFLQILYVSSYSFTTSVHYILMISIGVMTVFICGNQFVRYFSGIIYIYAIISLVCYSLLKVGIQIPFIPIASTRLDGDNIMRVYNLYYTQLGNPMENIKLGLRNCGPFWEPGAFQGFLNLSLFFELTTNQVRDKWWKLRIVTFVTAVFTTLSTGGYITLFAILIYFFSQDKNVNPFIKIIFTLGGLALFYYLYTTLDFMGQKIETDEGRVKFSFMDFPTPFHMIFGYGYDPESFKNSSMISASSIYNLLRYLGIVGFFIYMINLYRNKTQLGIVYFAICSLILMNEPFLSCAMIFWGLAFVKYDIYNNTQIR